MIRHNLHFDTGYTQIPNAWVRDERLSWKARGLLAYLLSHRPGWSTSIASLVKVGLDGRDGVRAGITELEAAGYLVREQGRDAGTARFSEVDYVLCDPFAVPPSAEKPSTAEPPTEVPPTELPSTAHPTPKKTIPTEHQPEEHQPPEEQAAGAALFVLHPESLASEDQFDKAWSAWPKKDKKIPSQQKWARLSARDRASILPVLLAHAEVYRQHPTTEFVPALAAWLHQQRWNDPLPPRRTGNRPTSVRQQNLDFVAEMERREAALIAANQKGLTT